MVLAQLDDIFAQTLLGDYDDDAPWQAVWSLRRIGTRNVFDEAVKWTESPKPLLRARGRDARQHLPLLHVIADINSNA